MAGVELGTAYLSLVADTKGLAKSVRKGLGEVESEADRTGRNSGASIGGGIAKGVGVAGAAVVGLTALVGGLALTGGISRALNIEDAQGKLKGLGHSTESVKAIMDNALASVKGTAFGMGEAATVAASAVAAGVKPGQDLERTLKLVADASTIAGTDMGEMGLIFNKVAASNKVQGEVINQLNERGIPIIQLLAAELGTTAEETVNLASAGKINFDTFRNAMEAGLGGAALKSGETTRGAFKNMMAALSRVGEQLIGGVFPMFAGFFMGVTGMLDRIAPAAKAAGIWFGALVSSFATTMSGLFQVLRSGDFTAELRASLGMEEDSPVIAGVLWLRDTALGAFAEIRGGFTAMSAAFRDGGTDVTSSGLAGFLESIGLAARGIWDAIGPTVKELAPSVLALATAFSPLGIILQGIAPVLPALAIALGEIAAAIGGVLVQVLPVLAEAFAEIGAELAGAIMQALPALVPLFETLAEVIPTLTPALLVLIPLVAGFAADLIRLVTPLLTNENTIKALALAFVGWKLAMVGISLTGLITSLAKATLALGANTIAWLKNTAAAVVSKGQTLILMAMYAGSFVASLARATLAWLTNTAGIVGNRLALVAHALATRAMSMASFVATLARGTLAWVVQTSAIVGNRVAVLAVAAGQRAMALAQGIATAAQWAFNAALNANPIGLIILAIAALVAGFVWFFTKTEIGRKIVAAAWSGIQSAISAVADWWTGTAWPAIQRVIEWFSAAFQVAGAVIANVWAAIQSGISAAWSWINSNVFDPFKAGVALIGVAFESVRDVIGRAWDGLKAIAAKPVNFILGTVYNDGIREWWNKIAGAVGLDSLSLPKAPLVKFASGGVLPGYTPGRDVHQFYSPTGGRLALSGGEAIMRPEFTRAVGGPAGVARLNMAARRGQAFKDGGVFDFFGDAWDTVKGVGKGIWDAASMAVEVVKDPVGAIKKAVVDGIITPLMGKVGVDGDFVKILTQLPVKFAGGLADKVKSMFASQESTMANGNPGSGVGLGRMGQMLQAVLPGARVTSSFRAGARTAGFGSVSFHALGRALDIGAGGGRSLSQIWDVLNAAYGSQSQELLYTPKGANQILRGGKRGGTSGVTAKNHYSHVHWAMKNGGVIPGLYDNGGWMNPGQMGINLTSKPEAVLTPEESAALKNNLGGGPMIGQLVVHDGKDAVREFDSYRRREMTRARLGVVR